MLTVSQVARIANVAPNTVRNYARQFPDLFTEAARGLQGDRRFDDEDVATLCTLVQLRASGMTLAEAAHRIRGDATPAIIDVPASTLQDAASPTDAPEAPQTALVALSTMQARLDALERQQTTLLRAAALWGALLGAIVALAAGSFVLWILYLLG